MLDIDKLKHFMEPYYQDITDETLLQEYLDENIYPECAASKLWYELQGKVGFQNEGISKINTGAEKFEYSQIGTLQLACERNGKYYDDKCKELNQNGSLVVRIAKGVVGGVTEDYGSN